MTTPMVQVIPEERGEDADLFRFTRLAKEYYQPVYGFVARQVRSPEDAEDLTQQVFVKAFRGFHRFDGSREFAPWIYSIARRHLADFFRSNREQYSELDVDPADPDPDPGSATAATELRHSVWEAARQLKPKFHQVLLLHYQEDFPLRETARIMGLSQTHVKVLLFRARNALKRRLQTSPEFGGNSQ